MGDGRFHRAVVVFPTMFFTLWIKSKITHKHNQEKTISGFVIDYANK